MGEGSVRYGEIFTYSYLRYGTFEVELTVKDEQNSTGKDSVEVVIANAIPVAILSIKSPETVKGVDIEFDATGSYDLDGEIVEYYFNFGDNTESDWIVDPTVSHRYYSVGTYNVTLMVTDNLDTISDPYYLELYIKEKVNQPPTITITSPVENDQVAGVVTIEGSATDRDSRIEEIEIKINDDSWEEARIVEGKDDTAFWEFEWNTEDVDDGEHIISVRAYDGEKYSNERAIKVRVNNRPTTFIEISEKLDPDKCLPGESVTVSGTAKYDTGVPVKNTNVKIEIEKPKKSWTAKTNSQGRYSYKIKAPDSPGKYTVSVFITDGTLDHSESKELTVRMPPDFVITTGDLAIATKKDKFQQKDRISIRATIHNNGEIPAEGKILFYLDSKDNLPFDTKTITIPAGGSMLVTAIWIARTGEHNIIAIITDVSPDEVDETNNEASIKIIVASTDDSSDEDSSVLPIGILNDLPPTYRYAILGGIVLIIIIIIGLAIAASKRKKPQRITTDLKARPMTPHDRRNKDLVEFKPLPDRRGRTPPKRTKFEMVDDSPFNQGRLKDKDRSQVKFETL
jgi:hypothetical protein